MPHLIHEDRDPQASPRWTITQHPAGTTDPLLVHWRKRSRIRTLLDQVARWDAAADGWDPSRWVPRFPIVPRDLLDLVEQHMRGVEL
jgi:hypothetical protein